MGAYALTRFPIEFPSPQAQTISCEFQIDGKTRAAVGMPTEDYVYKTFDEAGQCLARVRYQESDSLSRAIAIACHGGGWCAGSKESIPQGQVDWLTNNGFVVVAYDYRLCPNISLMKGPISDTREVYHWSRNVLPGLMKRDFGVVLNIDRIVAFGGSAGGHLAMCLGHETPRPRAILNIYGFQYFSDPAWKNLPVLPVLDSNPTVMAKIFDDPVLTSADANDMDLSHPRPAWVMDKFKRGTILETLCGADLDAHDPAAMKGGLTKNFPPTFFLHGSEDVLVPVTLAQKCCAELASLSVDTGIIVMDGGGHGFDGDLREGDQKFEKFVQPGFDFLKSHV